MGRYFLLMLFVFGVSVNGAHGQMIRTTADTTIVTSYSSLDSIYIFHQLPTSKQARLAARSPYTDPSTFTWWSLNAKTFAPESILPATPSLTGDTSSVLPVKSGGYRVDIKNNLTSASTSYYGWILKDTLISKLNKDIKGNLSFGYSHCKFIDLIDSIRTQPFVYANPLATAQTDTLKSKLRYQWTTSPLMDTPIFNSDTGTVSYVRIDSPPYEDTHFMVTVSNQFGLSLKDTVMVISIRPHAIFDTLNCKNYEKLQGNTYLSAPFQANFVNKSNAKAIHFNWYFDNGDTLFNTKDPKTEIYYYPKKVPGQTDTLPYVVKLVAKSAQLCVDTAKMNLLIAVPKIDNWELYGNSDTVKIPNAFTPDGANPYFRPFTVSVKLFHLTIFSRTGKTVYEFEGGDQKLHDWMGWDGKIRSTGIDASPGIYFYIIESVPWDKDGQNVFPKKGIYKGYVYLFRP